MSSEMRALVKGRVQGVGFRATAKFYAEKLKLVGFARNLASGEVEICAQGEKRSLDTFINHLKQEFGAYIHEVILDYKPISKPLSGFQIL